MFNNFRALTLIGIGAVAGALRSLGLQACAGNKVLGLPLRGIRQVTGVF